MQGDRTRGEIELVLLYESTSNSVDDGDDLVPAKRDRAIELVWSCAVHVGNNIIGNHAHSEHIFSRLWVPLYKDNDLNTFAVLLLI